MKKILSIMLTLLLMIGLTSVTFADDPQIGIITNPVPSAAGTGGLGSATKPYGNAFIGNAATNNIEITGTATSAVILTLPATTGTVALSNSPVALTPSTVNSVGLGTAALPWQNLVIGNQATNVVTIQPAAGLTSAALVTVPGGTFTLSGVTTTWCGTTNACSNTSTAVNAKIVSGVTNLVTNAAVITGMPAFTSSTSFACSLGYSAVGVVNYSVANTSSISIAANAGNGTVSYTCIGY